LLQPFEVAHCTRVIGRESLVADQLLLDQREHVCLQPLVRLTMLRRFAAEQSSEESRESADDAADRRSDRSSGEESDERAAASSGESPSDRSMIHTNADADQSASERSE